MGEEVRLQGSHHHRAHREEGRPQGAPGRDRHGRHDRGDGRAAADGRGRRGRAAAGGGGGGSRGGSGRDRLHSGAGAGVQGVRGQGREGRDHGAQLRPVCERHPGLRPDPLRGLNQNHYDTRETTQDEDQDDAAEHRAPAGSAGGRVRSGADDDRVARDGRLPRRAGRSARDEAGNDGGGAGPAAGAARDRAAERRGDRGSAGSGRARARVHPLAGGRARGCPRPLQERRGAPPRPAGRGGGQG